MARRIAAAGRRGAPSLALAALAAALIAPHRAAAHPSPEHVVDSAGSLTASGVMPGLAGEADATGPIAACTGPSPNQGSEPIDEDLAITGSFGDDLEGSYVMLPFDVPNGTDAIRVKYCHDQPLLEDPQGLNRHTLDIGLYEPRTGGEGVWGRDEFRGWGGSSRKDVTVSPRGTIDPDPNPVARQETTVGFVPGPIPSGRWAVELGVAAVAEELPVEDGVVRWRVEIDLIDDPAFSDQPYEPVSYDESRPATSPAGMRAISTSTPATRPPGTRRCARHSATRSAPIRIWGRCATNLMPGRARGSTSSPSPTTSAPANGRRSAPSKATIRRSWSCAAPR